MKIDVCMSPALYPAYHDPEAIVVVVDIFRASTTIVTAFCNGAKAIRPVATVEEAFVYKQQGWLVGAERNVRRCDFADFGNSPFDYTPEKVQGQEIAFTTTNGTVAITTARNAWQVLVGAFLNLDAIAIYCIDQQRNVIVLCSGWNNKINIEDTLFGGALVDRLVVTGHFHTASDAAVIAWDMWKANKDNLPAYMERTDHLPRLQQNNLDDSVAYCLAADTTNVVPQLVIKEDILILENS